MKPFPEYYWEEQTIEERIIEIKACIKRTEELIKELNKAKKPYSRQQTTKEP